MPKIYNHIRTKKNRENKKWTVCRGKTVRKFIFPRYFENSNQLFSPLEATCPRSNIRW